MQLQSHRPWCCKPPMLWARLGVLSWSPAAGQGAVITSVTIGKLVLRPQLLMLGIFPLHACSSLHNVQTICTEYFFLLFYHLINYLASENFVSDIAMPFLGAGRDKLDFYNVVFPMIKTVFEHSPINIHIYYPKSQVIHMKRLVYVCSHAQYYSHLYLLQLLLRCSHSDKYLTI